MLLNTCIFPDNSLDTAILCKHFFTHHEENKEELPMRLFPKTENFFDYFEELADKIEEGGQLFLEMTQTRDFSDVRVAKLKEIEHEADGITHKTYEKMHKTFLTPIDREDIYALVNKMDSIMDVIEATAIRIHLYKVKKPADEIIKQAQILNDAIKKVKSIVHAMRNMKNSEMILNHCVEINTLENAGDVVLRTIMANLFEN
jgi:predicted phosphate transport protein (TIGR00153 family)